MHLNNTTNRDRKQERAQIYLRGRVVGGIVADTFRKHVRASKHFLRSPAAIAFDLDVIAQAKERGAQFAEVIDDETGEIFRAPISRIWKKGFHVDRGHGNQIALALDEWNKDDEPTADQLRLL